MYAVYSYFQKLLCLIPHTVNKPLFCIIGYFKITMYNIIIIINKP